MLVDVEIRLDVYLPLTKVRTQYRLGLMIVVERVISRI